MRVLFFLIFFILLNNSKSNLYDITNIMYYNGIFGICENIPCINLECNISNFDILTEGNYYIHNNSYIFQVCNFCTPVTIETDFDTIIYSSSYKTINAYNYEYISRGNTLHCSKNGTSYFELHSSTGIIKFSIKIPTMSDVKSSITSIYPYRKNSIMYAGEVNQSIYFMTQCDAQYNINNIILSDNSISYIKNQGELININYYQEEFLLCDGYIFTTNQIYLSNYVKRVFNNTFQMGNKYFTTDNSSYLQNTLGIPTIISNEEFYKYIIDQLNEIYQQPIDKILNFLSQFNIVYNYQYCWDYIYNDELYPKYCNNNYDCYSGFCNLITNTCNSSDSLLLECLKMEEYIHLKNTYIGDFKFNKHYISYKYDNNCKDHCQNVEHSFGYLDCNCRRIYTTYIPTSIGVDNITCIDEERLNNVDCYQNLCYDSFLNKYLYNITLTECDSLLYEFYCHGLNVKSGCYAGLNFFINNDACKYNELYLNNDHVLNQTLCENKEYYPDMFFYFDNGKEFWSRNLVYNSTLKPSTTWVFSKRYYSVKIKSLINKYENRLDYFDLFQQYVIKNIIKYINSVINSIKSYANNFILLEDILDFYLIGNHNFSFNYGPISVYQIFNNDIITYYFSTSHISLDQQSAIYLNNSLIGYTPMYLNCSLFKCDINFISTNIIYNESFNLDTLNIYNSNISFIENGNIKNLIVNTSIISITSSVNFSNFYFYNSQLIISSNINTNIIYYDGGILQIDSNINTNTIILNNSILKISGHLYINGCLKASGTLQIFKSHDTILTYNCIEGSFTEIEDISPNPFCYTFSYSYSDTQLTRISNFNNICLTFIIPILLSIIIVAILVTIISFKFKYIRTTILPFRDFRMNSN